MIEDIFDILIKFFGNNKDIIMALFTALVGFAGAYFGGQMTLKATKLSIKNEEKQNRTVLMSIVSHMVILIENIQGMKDIAFSNNALLCNTFSKFKAYEKIWDLLPKSGLTVNEIKIIYLFNMHLEEAYEHYQIVSKQQNYDRSNAEWNLKVNFTETKNTKVLIKFTEENIMAVKKVIEKYFDDVNYNV